jgi:hypothetical protein
MDTETTMPIWARSKNGLVEQIDIAHDWDEADDLLKFYRENYPFWNVAEFFI